MLAPLVTVEKCKHCGKKKTLANGAFKGEWVCPNCGKTNKKKPLSSWMA